MLDIEVQTNLDKFVEVESVQYNQLIQYLILKFNILRFKIIIYEIIKMEISCINLIQ